MNYYQCYFAQDAWVGHKLAETGVTITTKLLNHFRKGMALLLSCDIRGWSFKKSATIRVPWSSFSFSCFCFILPYSLLASKHHVKAKKSVSRTFNSIRFNVYFLVSYWGIHVCNPIYHGKWLLSSHLLSDNYFSFWSSCELPPSLISMSDMVFEVMLFNSYPLHALPGLITQAN